MKWPKTANAQYSQNIFSSMGPPGYQAIAKRANGTKSVHPLVQTENPKHCNMGQQRDYAGMIERSQECSKSM